jgi:hypothetical protein
MALRLFGAIKNTRLLILLVLVLTLPILVGLVNKRTNFINKAYLSLIGEKADLVIDFADTRGELNRKWADFAQGGEEKRGMFKSIISQMKKLQPNYIRIDHIYDYYEVVAKDEYGNLIFNWDKLDEEIADINSMGAKPFISLSYMPSAISTGSEVDLPTSWDLWQEIIKNTIEHISGTKELAIAGVYYEVWNEPDLFGNFKIGRDKDYLLLYKYAALGAKDAKNTLPYKFGGPATTALYKSWFDELISFVRKDNLRLDFFSWHRYSADISDYKTDLLNLISWKKELSIGNELELVISETGMTTENSEYYDNLISAIHTISLFALTSNYQNLKVFTFEVKDGPGHEQYWGRWGVLTHEKFGNPVEKPRFKAIEFMNLLKGDYVPVRGQGTWVRAFAARDEDEVRLLIVNYDRYKGNYENVPIFLKNLPFNSASLKIREFSGVENEYDIYLEDNEWETNHLMKPNSAVFIELISKE